MDELKKSFEQPGVEYRGLPFWSWNDQLEPDQLKEQFRAMIDAGLGGAFMHARVGLDTPYLGDKWMECIEATFQEADATGGQAWLYDEDCWPSGDCSKRVTTENPAFRQKQLDCEIVKRENFEAWAENTVAVYVVAVDDGQVVDAVHVENIDELDEYETDTVLHVFYETTDYIDTLNLEAVARFIELTHEVYLQRFGDRFAAGKIPGIFTDEPQFRYPAWSEGLPARFKDDHNLDLLDYLPWLWYDHKNAQRTRHDYLMTVTDMFVEAFSKQLGKWCDEHGIDLTGHMMSDNSLVDQCRRVGNVMAHLEHFQVPGIDHLGRVISNPVLPRQASSVAHQLGRPWVLSEMFGCSGWNVSFEDLRWIAAWQFVHGINKVCQHLSLYSLRGCRKRDYPPSLHWQQPWWPHYKKLNDAMARMLVLTTAGEHEADALVLSPIRTVWMGFGARDQEMATAISGKFDQLCQTLSTIHVTYDLGDEQLLARSGRVEGDRFVVGQCRYRAVVVPYMMTLLEDTWELLKQFKEAGGKVLVVGTAPSMLRARKSRRKKDEVDVQEWGKTLDRVADAGAAEALQKHLDIQVNVSNDWGIESQDILVHHRRLGDRHIVLLFNEHQQRTVKTAVRLPGTGSIERWNTDDGTVESLPARVSDERTVAELTIGPKEPVIVVFDPAGQPMAPERTREKQTVTMDLSSDWSKSPMGYNCLTLDEAQFRVDEGEWEDVYPMFELNREVAALGRDLDLELKFTVEVDYEIDPSQELFLVMEQPDAHRLTINGQEVPTDDRGQWYDMALRKVDITGRLKQGANELVLSRRYVSDDQLRGLAGDDAIHDVVMSRRRMPTEIESVYIIGDFLVDNADPLDEMESPRSGGTLGVPIIVASGQFRLRQEPAWRDSAQDLVSSGYPFYAGSFSFKRTVTVTGEIERAVLSMSRPEAITAEVKVNGTSCGVLAWQPWSVDITDALHEGDNEVEVVLTGSLRNAMGPHHLSTGETYWCGPFSFTDQLGQRDGETVWDDDYHFVRFGLSESIELTLVPVEPEQVEQDLPEDEEVDETGDAPAPMEGVQDELERIEPDVVEQRLDDPVPETNLPSEDTVSSSPEPVAPEVDAVQPDEPTHVQAGPEPAGGAQDDPTTEQREGTAETEPTTEDEDRSVQ